MDVLDRCNIGAGAGSQARCRLKARVARPAALAIRQVVCSGDIRIELIIANTMLAAEMSNPDFPHWRYAEMYGESGETLPLVSAIAQMR
jgi:hypothetical protein